MGTDIDVLQRNVYVPDIQLTAMQQGSLLRKHVRTDFSGRGTNIYFDFMGEFPMGTKVSRHQVVPIADPPFSRRKINLITKMGSSMVDRDDVLKAVDPTSAITKAAGYAAGKQWDILIAAALNGNSYSVDETGAETAIALTQSIAAGAAGFTWDKLRILPRMFLHQHVDIRNEDVCLVISSQQNGDLINLTEIKNGQYRAAMNPQISNGILTSVMGMTVEVYEDLPVDATPDRSCYAFCRSGVGLAVPEDIIIRIGDDPSRGFNPKIYVETTGGATRLQETHVIRIICREV